MSTSENIIQALKATVEATGFDVEIDRIHDVGKNDLPLAIINIEGESTEDFQGQSSYDWDRFWRLDLSVNYHVSLKNSQTRRAEINAIWEKFLSEFGKSAVHNFVAQAHPVDVRKDIVPTDDKSIAVLAIELSIIFER